jgi:hypothetical protein
LDQGKSLRHFPLADGSCSPVAMEDLRTKDALKSDLAALALDKVVSKAIM